MPTRREDTRWSVQTSGASIGRRLHGPLGAGVAAACLALLVLMIAGAPARAQDITLRTELGVRLTQIGSPSGGTASAFRVEPRYQLSWRGPLHGGTNVYADLGSTGSLITEPGTLGTEQSYQLNLHSQADALSLNASLSRSSDSFSLLQPDGSHQTLGSRTDAIALNGILSYPNYPLVSVQHQRAKASSGFSTGSTTSATIIGTNYDLGPLRLSLDRQWQSAGTGGQNLSNMQYGVNFRTALTPVAQLTAYHYGSFSRSGGVEGFRSTNQTTTMRLSALPTPFLVLDGELTYSQSSQERLGATVDSSFFSHALTLRSDPLRGVRLNLSERAQTGGSSGFNFDSQQYAVDVGVSPARNTQLLATLASSRFKAFGSPTPSRQDQQQISFAMPLLRGADLHAAYYRSFRSQGDGGDETRTMSVGVSGGITDQIIGSATYRSDLQRFDSAGDHRRNQSQSFQIQANWLPNPDWDLTLGIDAIRSSGARRTMAIQPIIEARWNMTPATTLTARYYAQRIREFDPGTGDPVLTFSGTSSFLSARLTRQLTDTDSFELAYDAQRISSGLSRFRRIVECRWLKRF